MNVTQQALMTETMKIVAEVGLDGLSMRQVADRVGVSNSIIYQYFDTKENLLYESFLQVNHEIVSFFENVVVDKRMKGKKVLQFIHDEWVRYFKFMVANDYKSMFYYAYRDSVYLDKVLSANNQAVAQETTNFFKKVQDLVKNPLLKERLMHDYFWLFIVDGTGMFVKHIIRDKIPMEQVDVEKIFSLIFGGVKSFITE